MERRLVAILAADMVGYSRLMVADEEGTITLQKTHRSELIDPAIAKHDGRELRDWADCIRRQCRLLAQSRRSAPARPRSAYRRIADVRRRMSVHRRITDLAWKGAEGRFMTHNRHSASIDLPSAQM